LRLVAQCDLVIAVSEASRDDLFSLAAADGLAAPTVTVIRWPVPFDVPRPPFTPPPTGRRNVLYVSRLKQVKNHTALLAACELLWAEGREFSLTLIGCEDEPRESAAIRREIDRLAGVGRAIRWRAQVPEGDLHEAYRSASFTVFPSRREGFGLPIVESFWHGRGVICSGTEAMGEISRGPGAIAVDVTQPAAIADAMRTLLNNDAACLALAQAAYARALRSWDDHWAELAPVLAS
jgi:glycosyltransferase involved in cell wall biosynthesis